MTDPSFPNVKGISNKTQLVMIILLFRILYLLAMMTSCHFIPEHNPGDGVVQFPLRLESYGCFCLHDHVCADLVGDGFTSTGRQNIPTHCAISLPSNDATTRNIFGISAWNFVLSPFTKWDAARFLSLAVQPQLRDPTLDSFDQSEQAHAFLPLFPWILRTMAFGLYRILPLAALPPTFEALVVLCGILFNNLVCLTISTLALYELTMQAVIWRIGQQKMKSLQPVHHQLAVAVCLIFGIWNPASVFFATNYSESFFFTTMVLGHVCMQQCDGQWAPSFVWWSCGIICWMVGSHTRSNGTIHALWLMQNGLSQICHTLRMPMQSWRRKALPITWIIFYTVLGGILIVLPVRYHDWMGYQRHCGSTSSSSPTWCLDFNQNPSRIFSQSSFSLYHYVQNKHWNVGLFQYYQWKQIPNFLLAAPILVLSFVGTHLWITWSLVTEFGKGKMPSLQLAASWPCAALSESIWMPRIEAARCPDCLLKNPGLLGHYAILAILALIGLVIAHVQISTRLICSTSPAIYWFMAYCMLAPDSAATRQVVWGYAILYMILGVVLHVNTLPWT
jgi:phosphatidylinositol glycan class V